MRRDKKVREIEKGAGPRTQKIITFLGDLNVPLLRADTPIGRLKRLQLTDNRAIDKGVEKMSLIIKTKKELNGKASLTQVKLHPLNFRADDPENRVVNE